MSIEFNWHTTLPILIATYVGNVTPKAYAAMCDQRRDLLAERGGDIVLLLDMRQLESVRDPQAIITDNPLYEGQVAHVVIVIASDLYDHVARSRIPADSSGLLVQLFGDWQTGVEAAERLAAGLN